VVKGVRVSAIVSRELLRAWRVDLASFDPALLSGEDCAAMVGEFAALEKACAAARR
jgi:hypothetical protein